MEDITIDNLFKSLKTFIDDKDFDQALALLEKNKENFDPGVYHFNLASIFALKQLPVEARIHYELAQAKGYVSPELKADLFKIKETLQIVEAERPDGLMDHINYFYTALPIDIYLTTALLLVMGLLMGFKQVAMKMKIIFLAVLILPFGGGFYHFLNTSVIILKDDHIVRAGPSRIFTETVVVPKGIKLLTGKPYTDYIEILYPEQYSGWIDKTGHFILRE